jgi:phosphohistidine phosphatase
VDRNADGEVLRTLILLRHGKSDYPGGTRDFDRPLGDRGEIEASLAGRWLKETQPVIDSVLCSPALRTRHTLAATRVAAPTTYARELYEAAPDDILTLLRDFPDEVRTLLVIGHAPGLPGLADDLAGPGSDQDAADHMRSRFPTSAIAVLTFTGPWSELDSATASLTAFEIARHPGHV